MIQQEKEVLYESNNYLLLIVPQFITDIPDLCAYDIIFLGYPVWAQDVPVFVADFISKCQMTGKKVIPFATFGLSGISWTKKTLGKICKGAEILYPFDYGMFKKDDYEKWINDIKAIPLIQSNTEIKYL